MIYRGNWLLDFGSWRLYRQSISTISIPVSNLKPRMMRGLESQGMICAASLEDGTGEIPALATFIENVDIGARLK